MALGRARKADGAVNVGNPHLVFFVADVDAIDLDSLGPRIEHDPAFPERINVNVAAVQPDGSVKLRTWERGAGLTCACGTGACATAVAAIASKRAQSPVKVTMPGGTLTIAWAPGEPIRMRGPATYVFKGEIDLEALCMSVETITLGCRLNFAESEAMSALAPAGEDWVIVNSCAVTNEAVRQTPPGDPPRAPRAARRENPRHRMRGPARARPLSRDARGRPGPAQAISRRR